MPGTAHGTLNNRQKEKKDTEMKTLIEIYDDRPIENILGTEVFRPEETILLCPPEAAANKRLKENIAEYFRYREIATRLTIAQVSLLDAGKIEAQLLKIFETHQDCAIDISGGTETALFAAGAVSGNLPVFTFSRRKNRFFEVRNAPFARDLPCTVQLSAEACFKLTGGKLLPGRENNEEIKKRIPMIDRLFRVFGKYRRVWRTQITYIQKISSSEPGELLARGGHTVRTEQGSISVNPDLLQDLLRNQIIRDLHITPDTVSFAFPDETVRFWLRDIGAVLELQVFRACLEAGCFQDVVLSAIVNWEGLDSQRNTVTNEIDVVAVNGIWPVFISCKTNELRTEALNELAILKNRFGGDGSRAIIVTSAPATRSRSLLCRRAAEMDIAVIEWNDLQTGRLIERLKKETGKSAL